MKRVLYKYGIIIITHVILYVLHMKYYTDYPCDIIHVTHVILY